MTVYLASTAKIQKAANIYLQSGRQIFVLSCKADGYFSTAQPAAQGSCKQLYLA